MSKHNITEYPKEVVGSFEKDREKYLELEKFINSTDFGNSFGDLFEEMAKANSDEMAQNMVNELQFLIEENFADEREKPLVRKYFHKNHRQFSSIIKDKINSPENAYDFVRELVSSIEARKPIERVISMLEQDIRLDKLQTNAAIQAKEEIGKEVEKLIRDYRGISNFHSMEINKSSEELFLLLCAKGLPDSAKFVNYQMSDEERNFYVQEVWEWQGLSESLEDRKTYENKIGIRNRSAYFIANACNFGYSSVVKALLEANKYIKEDINKPVTDWNPLSAPIHLACKNGNQEVLQVLMDYNADLTIRDFENKTALELACLANSLEVVQTLLNRGVDSNELNKGLYTACKNGNSDVVELLLSKNANPNARVDGDHPLHIACEKGFAKIIDILLREGADRNQRNSLGYSAADILMHNNFYEIFKSFVEREPAIEINEKSLLSLQMSLNRTYENDAMYYNTRYDTRIARLILKMEEISPGSFNFTQGVRTQDLLDLGGVKEFLEVSKLFSSLEIISQLIRDRLQDPTLQQPERDKLNLRLKVIESDDVKRYVGEHITGNKSMVQNDINDGTINLINDVNTIIHNRDLRRINADVEETKEELPLTNLSVAETTSLSSNAQQPKNSHQQTTVKGGRT